jgi:hypothetical protein
MAVVAADDDPVGLKEVVNRASLAKVFRVRTTIASCRVTRSSRWTPDEKVAYHRDGGLVEDDRRAVTLRQRNG